MRKITFLPLYISVFLLFFISAMPLSAQQESAAEELPSWRWSPVIGFGSSSLSSLPDEIYQDGGGNFQFGVQLERRLSKRFSWVSMLEYEGISYSINAIVQPLGGNGGAALQVPMAGEAFPRIQKGNAALGLYGRYYVFQREPRNACDFGRGVFIQGGARVAQTLFARSSFVLGNERSSSSIQEFINPQALQFELAVGFTGEFPSVLALLSSSVLGINVQTTPLFREQGELPAIQPVHLTWRFVF